MAEAAYTQDLATAPLEGINTTDQALNLDGPVYDNPTLEALRINIAAYVEGTHPDQGGFEQLAKVLGIELPDTTEGTYLAGYGPVIADWLENTNLGKQVSQIGIAALKNIGLSGRAESSLNYIFDLVHGYVLGDDAEITEATATLAGTAAGAWAGAKSGAAYGAGACSIFLGAGTVTCGTIGGVVGGVAGAFLGEEAVELLFNSPGLTLDAQEHLLSILDELPADRAVLEEMGKGLIPTISNHLANRSINLLDALEAVAENPEDPRAAERVEFALHHYLSSLDSIITSEEDIEDLISQIRHERNEAEKTLGITETTPAEGQTNPAPSQEAGSHLRTLLTERNATQAEELGEVMEKLRNAGVTAENPEASLSDVEQTGPGTTVNPEVAAARASDRGGSVGATV